MEQPNASEAMRRLLSSCVPGDILQGTVEAVDEYGVGVRVGGAHLTIPRERIALSPACGPERFALGQTVWAVVWRIDRQNRTITLTHRELLGTFAEVSRGFDAGTLCRAIAIDAAQVELAPNLTAEVTARAGAADAGAAVLFRVREIDRRGGRVCGEICATTDACPQQPFTYYITNGRIKHWSYLDTGQNFCAQETSFAR